MTLIVKNHSFSQVLVIFRDRIPDLELDRKGQKRLRNIRDFLFTHSFFSTSQKKDTDPFSPKGKTAFCG